MLLRPHRSSRSRLSLLAAGALLASPLLAGCGMHYATDRVNTISAGINDQSGATDVAILGSVVIAQEDNAGFFVATLVNKSRDAFDYNGETPTPVEGERADLTGVTLDGTAAELTEDVVLQPGSRTSLIHAGGVPVTGEFTAGDFVEVTLTFSSGQVTTVEVPVVTACHQYRPSKLTTIAFAKSEEEVNAEVDADGEPGAYSCEPSEQVDHHGGGEGGEGEEH